MSKINLKQFLKELVIDREIFKNDEELKFMKKRLKDKIIHDSPLFEFFFGNN